MHRTSRAAMVLMWLTCGLLLSSPAAAQQASGITGVVRDTSGGVLPGVTVEAASPALIEKVRTAVTDSRGRYNIVDLRPGTYAVTFTLPGFTIVRREGIALTAGFTATVNADLAVGGVAETVTVTGESPVVDVQNVRQQEIISKTEIDALPVYSVAATAVMATVPGMILTAQADVGGNQSNHDAAAMIGRAAYHGKRNFKMTFDGMRINQLEGPGAANGYIVNNVAVEEIQIETGGVTAESAGAGGGVNVIPKSGGNIFSGSVVGLFSGSSFESDNFNDRLRERGLQRTAFPLERLYDAGGTLGGPIMRDRLWFFTAQRWNGTRNGEGPFPFNRTQGTPVYTPDPSRPFVRRVSYRSHAVRLTWQASERNRVGAFADVQEADQCRQSTSLNSAPEAHYGRLGHMRLYQGTWTLPATNRLLFEAGASAAVFRWPICRPEGVGLDSIAMRELSTGFTYNALRSFSSASYDNGRKVSDRYAQRVAMSFVTGSHAFKAGAQLEQGVRDFDQVVPGDVWYDFLRGRPSAITQFATPYRTYNKLKTDLGLFAQDQWTVNRLTLNMGLRFEYFKAYVPEIDLPAGPFVPARRFAAVKDVPSWTDLSPRLGAAYDVFGTGRTALKVTLGRYVSTAGMALTEANSPLVTTVNQATRGWNDLNGNFIPDCNLRSPAANGECERLDNQNFGQLNIRTRYADDVLSGFGVRESFWDFSAELQHELMAGVSVSGGYYRNWHSNFTATDNLAVTPDDYSPYCVQAPSDPRLPGGDSYQVCGLYDIAPAKLGQVNNLVAQASNFGKPTQVSDFFAVNLNTRLGSGMQLGGGIDTGRTASDRCFVIDSPQQLLHCRVVMPFEGLTQVKVFGSYMLPADVMVSATFQNVPGPPIAANWTVRRDQIIGLGRPLSTNTTTVPLVAPNAEFEDRRTQLDLRVGKSFSLPNNVRVLAKLDVYNVLNGSAILTRNDTFGSAWGRPNLILAPRVIHLGADVTF